MKIWNQAPLVRLLLPFICGIITAVYLPLRIPNLFLILLPYFLFVISVTFIPALRLTYKRSWIFGIVINILLFALAYQITIDKTLNFHSRHFAGKVTGTSYVLATISQSPIEKEKTIKAVLNINSVQKDGIWEDATGKVMAYFKKDASSNSLKYGDEIMLHASFREIPDPQNPGEFNYKRFLSFHNIYMQSYVDEKSWISTGNNKGNAILKYSYGLRDHLLGLMQRNNINGDEYAVGAALMLGYSDKLDADIISAYSSTGALHVLSVSGLHVAIVYVVFNWLLFFFDKFKYGNIIKAAILIVLLWFYSALTGLSPSVLRAATMFSFIIIGKAFERHTNIYNTLAASAFLLLCINPFLIMEVGFQLSYIAVIGIVYLQPKIYAWYEPGTWFADQVWTITAVSIAAQVATFPLGLHYFHQFPNYFLLSNFIVIPVSTIIIYIGIAMFIFSAIPVAAFYLSAAFSWCVWFLNYSVKLIEKWPYSLLQNISISVLETWILYGMIFLFLFYFTKRLVTYLSYALMLAILILASQIIEQSEQYKQNKLIIYNVPKVSAIDFVSSKQNVLLTDSSYVSNESSQLFHIKHNWWELGITHSKIISGNHTTKNLAIENGIVQFFKKRIVIINHEKELTFKASIPIQVDYLVVSHDPKIKINDILKTYSPAKIIFDSSNTRKKLLEWKKECTDLAVESYSVSESGAFQENI